MSALPVGAPAWVVETRHADAATLHGPWPAPGDMGTRRVAVCRVGGPPTLVLGSAQGRFGNDPARTDRPGAAVALAGPLDAESGSACGGRTAVVRRRGGGGAVLVAGGAQVWIDVWLPRTDPLWDDDVVRGARWVGEAWAAALHDTGFGPVRVHDGPSVAAPSSAAVCFAGVGPGEVLTGDPPQKIMGLTQHRTRHGVRFATMAHVRWDPDALVHALGALGLVDPSAHGEVVASVASRAIGLLDGAGPGPKAADPVLAGAGPGGGVVAAVEAATVRRLTAS